MLYYDSFCQCKVVDGLDGWMAVVKGGQDAGREGWKGGKQLLGKWDTL